MNLSGSVFTARWNERICCSFCKCLHPYWSTSYYLSSETSLKIQKQTFEMLLFSSCSPPKTQHVMEIVQIWIGGWIFQEMKAATFFFFSSELECEVNWQILPHHLLWLRIDSHALRGMTKSKSIYFLQDADPWCQSAIRKEFNILSLCHSSEIPPRCHNSSEDSAITTKAVCVRFTFARSFLRVLKSSG